MKNFFLIIFVILLNSVISWYIGFYSVDHVRNFLYPECNPVNMSPYGGAACMGEYFFSLYLTLGIVFLFLSGILYLILRKYPITQK